MNRKFDANEVQLVFRGTAIVGLPPRSQDFSALQTSELNLLYQTMPDDDPDKAAVAQELKARQTAR